MNFLRDARGNNASPDVFGDHGGFALDRISIAAAAGNEVCHNRKLRKVHSAFNFSRMGDGSPVATLDLIRLHGILPILQALQKCGAGSVINRANSADSRRIATKKTDALWLATVRTVADAAVLRAVDHVNAKTSGPAVELAGAPAIQVKIAGEVQERVLHLDALHIADSTGGDVHITAAMHPVAGRRGAEAGPMSVVKTLGDRDAVAIMPAVEIS